MRRRSGRSARSHSPATTSAVGLVRPARGRIAPYSALHYGVIGDAMIELGRYEGAFAAFDRMVELRPSSSAYAGLVRTGAARQAAGRRRAMRLALASAAGHQERSAWVLSTSGSSPSHRARPR